LWTGSPRARVSIFPIIPKFSAIKFQEYQSSVTMHTVFSRAS